MDLTVGTRVQVLSDPEFGPGPWPSEPMGTITGGPGLTQGRNGDLVTYWVMFDEPQYDTDGSGPYKKSQVLDKYLRVETDR